MSPAAEILVIILSIFLAFFLLLSIILVIYLIVLTRQIRRVTMSAEHAIGNFQSVVSGISRVVSPMFLAKLASDLFKKFNKSRKGKDSDVED
jgi:hypothetical protein